MSHFADSTRRLFLCIVIIGCAQLVVTSNAAAQSKAEAKPPNILFIFADDWGWGDLGCHGHSHIETPHLDRLAKQGTDFHQFTVSNAVCSPSRVALLTGHYPARYCINRHFYNTKHTQANNMPDWLDHQAPMLPRMLRRQGYKTYHFGKWHLANFDAKDAPRCTAYGYDHAYVWNAPGESTTVDGVFDDVIEVIKNKADQPFFINLWIHEPHTPFFPREKFLKHYEDKGLGERERVYPAVITETDQKIGKVLAALDEAGLTDDTLVVFTSDNGPEYPNNQIKMGKGLGRFYSLGTTGGLRGAKRSLHEGGIRVPLIVRWPGKVPKDMVDKTNVITAVDWLPTLISIAGGELPSAYKSDGEDRSAALLGKQVPRMKPIYWYWPSNTHGYDWPNAAIREGKWKLIVGEDGARVELFDIPNDRTESSNLSEANRAVVELLREKLDAWLATIPERPNPRFFSEKRR